MSLPMQILLLRVFADIRISGSDFRAWPTGSLQGVCNEPHKNCRGTTGRDIYLHSKHPQPSFSFLCSRRLRQALGTGGSESRYERQEKENSVRFQLGYVHVYRTDDTGLLSYKDHLPVSEILIGDTNKTGSQVIYRIGPLRCYGDSR